MSFELLINVQIGLTVMFVAWLFYLKSKNPGIVDVYWGLGIMCCGQWLLLDEYFSAKVLFINALLMFWGLRLSLFLWYTRVRPQHIEKRYLDIAKSWKVPQKLGFLGNFLLQGFLLSIVALPFYFIKSTDPVTILDYIAFAVVLLGIMGEWLADYQLYSFKKAKSKQLCEKGLWNFSRHPNYFFELITWFGFCLFALPNSQGFLALISPLLLAAIMVFITGRITERVSVSHRGEQYIHYQKSTSMIIPWFKRRIK